MQQGAQGKRKFLVKRFDDDPAPWSKFFCEWMPRGYDAEPKGRPGFSPQRTKRTQSFAEELGQPTGFSPQRTQRTQRFAEELGQPTGFSPQRTQRFAEEFGQGGEIRTAGQRPTADGVFTTEDTEGTEVRRGIRPTRRTSDRWPTTNDQRPTTAGQRPLADDQRPLYLMFMTSSLRSVMSSIA
jgi:hypothetical protein